MVANVHTIFTVLTSDHMKEMLRRYLCDQMENISSNISIPALAYNNIVFFGD